MPTYAIAPKCEALKTLAVCLISKDGIDFWADFLETLIFPPESAGITPDLAQTIWTLAVTPGPDLAERQTAIATAFLESSGPNELASFWRTIVNSRATT